MATIKLNTTSGNIILLTDSDAEKIITLGTLEAFKELSDANYTTYVSDAISTLKQELSTEIANVQIKIDVENDRGLLDGGVGNDNTIYLFPITDTSTNQYEEYIYYDNKWELLGAVDIADMENYVKNTLQINGYSLTSDITLTTSDIGAVPTSRTINNKSLSTDITLSASDVGAATQGDITDALSSYVLKTVKINDYALSGDITLTASDVGALSSISVAASSASVTNGNVITAVDVNTTANGILYTKSNLTTDSIGAVPTSRTVNGYELEDDIELSASDVGALADGDEVYAALDAAGLFATTADIEALFEENT